MTYLGVGQLNVYIYRKGGEGRPCHLLIFSFSGEQCLAGLGSGGTNGGKFEIRGGRDRDWLGDNGLGDNGLIRGGGLTT